MKVSLTPGRAIAAACPCGSGLSYRFCHQSVSEAAPHDYVEVARRQYAEAWAGNAAHYAAQGLYIWLARSLADHLPGGKWTGQINVLDIGCGRGDGLAALRNMVGGRLGRLIGIDENPACLIAAADQIGLCGSDVGTRMRHHMLGHRAHHLDYDVGHLPRRARRALVHSDLLRPHRQLASALGTRTFDAITLWFTGTHKAREHDVLVKACGLHSDELYGIALECAAFGFAATHLRPGGLFQIASRGAHADLARIGAAFRAKLLAMAEVVPLSLIDLRLRRYSEPDQGRYLAVNSPNFDVCPLTTGVVSAIFRRD